MKPRDPSAVKAVADMLPGWMAMLEEVGRSGRYQGRTVTSGWLARETGAERAAPPPLTTVVGGFSPMSERRKEISGREANGRPVYAARREDACGGGTPTPGDSGSWSCLLMRGHTGEHYYSNPDWVREWRAPPA